MRFEAPYWSIFLEKLTFVQVRNERNVSSSDGVVVGLNRLEVAVGFQVVIKIVDKVVPVAEKRLDGRSGAVVFGEDVAKVLAPVHVQLVLFLSVLKQ